MTQKLWKQWLLRLKDVSSSRSLLMNKMFLLFSCSLLCQFEETMFVFLYLYKPINSLCIFVFLCRKFLTLYFLKQLAGFWCVESYKSWFMKEKYVSLLCANCFLVFKSLKNLICFSLWGVWISSVCLQTCCLYLHYVCTSLLIFESSDYLT